MSCVDDVQSRIGYAEGVISARGSTKGLYDFIFDAIFKCDQLGDPDPKKDLKLKNELMLKVDYHLDQFFRHAAPAAKSLNDIIALKPPEAPEIKWRPK